MTKVWWLMRGDVRVGELREYGIDQPTFLCHFVPGPGWEGVSALFEAWAPYRALTRTGVGMRRLSAP